MAYYINTLDGERSVHGRCEPKCFKDGDLFWKMCTSLYANFRKKNLIRYVLWKVFTPEPRPLKKGTFDSNAAINSEGSGDMSSTQYNQIWSSANSFFRNRQKFACFLEHWPEILIVVNWQWSLGKNSSLSKNWDYWEIAENMVKMHNLVNKSCCKPRLQSKSPLSKKLRLLRKTENFSNHAIFISKVDWHNECSQKLFLSQ